MFSSKSKEVLALKVISTVGDRGAKKKSAVGAGRLLSIFPSPS